VSYKLASTGIDPDFQVAGILDRGIAPKDPEGKVTYEFDGSRVPFTLAITLRAGGWSGGIGGSSHAADSLTAHWSWVPAAHLAMRLYDPAGNQVASTSDPVPLDFKATETGNWGFEVTSPGAAPADAVGYKAVVDLGAAPVRPDVEATSLVWNDV